MTVAPEVLAAGQPYEYQRRPLAEPDWTRFPGWRDVTTAQWESAQWQRVNCVKNIPPAPRTSWATCSTSGSTPTWRPTSSAWPPCRCWSAADAQHHGARTGRPTPTSFYADPIRRYMIPVATDRHLDWPSHPHATRDSLHEHDMWVAEGLTHRYPTKVLAELLSTCPQYCGHCTRMDLVGNSTPTVDKLKLTLKPVDRYDAAPGLPARTTRASATWWSPAATSPTCRGSSSRRT